MAQISDFSICNGSNSYAGESKGNDSHSGFSGFMIFELLYDLV